MLSALEDDPAVLSCRLLDGRVTLVHRRIWPALVRLAEAGVFPAGALDASSDTRTPRGQHEKQTTPFPAWVPADVRAEAERLSEHDARVLLAACGVTAGDRPPGRRVRTRR